MLLSQLLRASPLGLHLPAGVISRVILWFCAFASRASPSSPAEHAVLFPGLSSCLSVSLSVRSTLPHLPSEMSFYGEPLPSPYPSPKCLVHLLSWQSSPEGGCLVHLYLTDGLGLCQFASIPCAYHIIGAYI